MQQSSPAKVKVKEIIHACIVVEDVWRTLRNYWDILGIGPWEVYSFERPLVQERSYHGKPSWAREKLAMAQVGPVTLELAQPVEGDSIYRDFLDEGGEGLHHLSFQVDDLGKIEKDLECFPILQSARGGPEGHDYVWSYSYFDMKPLGCIWEPTEIKPGPIGEPMHYPENGQSSPAKVKVKEIIHACIVVEDVWRTLRNYWDILGIGPWEVYSFERPLVQERSYHGKPSWAREKLAMAQVGPVTLELAQPVEGDSIYRDFLDEGGEGLHHLSFQVDDLGKIEKDLECFPILQSARGGPEGHDYVWSYSYFDMKPLGCIWEPTEIKPGPIGEPMHYPENMDMG